MVWSGNVQTQRRQTIQLKKLYYRLYLKFTGLPARGQIIEASEFAREGSVYSEVLSAYIAGYEIEDIALGLDITRERVSQFLRKATR